MEANRRHTNLSLRPSLSLTLLIITLLCSNSGFIDANSPTIFKKDNNVTLELYYETLCPYCSKFIAEHLYKLFETGIIAITDLKLIPYGNAKVKPGGSIVCQHGEYECLLNTVEACAIDAWPKVNDHFPFIYCVENLVYLGKYKQWETCFKTLGLDSTPVSDCLSSGHGLELELKYATETNALQPPHQYVPWVVVDGQPLYDDYENFLSFVCNAYKGTAVPSACSELPVSVIRKRKWNIISPVCYKEAEAKLLGVRAAIISWINQLIY